MDLEQVNATLSLENKRLKQENGDLKLMFSIVKENIELKSKICGNNSIFLEEAGARKTSVLFQDILDESKFRRDLQQPNLKHAHKTSSPLNVEAERGYETLRRKIREPGRLIGEVAFQLEKRILAHVFQSQRRFYGFTVLNVQKKITEVSTHPLTGTADEGYRSALSQRFAELMERLNHLGYNAELHAAFAEFIINTYGVMKHRPDTGTIEEMGYNDPDVLREVILHTAPEKLLKDVLVLLRCLSFMASKDRETLFLW